MKSFLSIALGAVLAVGLVPAQAGDKEGRVCTKEYAVGSHLPKRVCTTTAQRDALRKQSQESAARQNERARLSATATTRSMGHK
jgi:hypothetical protein